MKKYILYLCSCLFLFFCFAVKSNGQIISTIAGTGTAGTSLDGIAATAAAINGPNAVCFDDAGNLYFCDANNNRVRKVNTSGIVTTIAGTGVLGFFGDGFAATTAQFSNPSAVVVDHAGNIYIGDQHNNRVRKINTSGIINTIAGSGTGGYDGDGTAATARELNYPYGLALDSHGNLYIGDQHNHRVRMVNTAGIISTVAGTGTPGYSRDGFPATSAELYYPTSISIDQFDNLFICDNNNFRIRKVNTSGIISTVAGNGIGALGTDGIAATASSLNYPSGVRVDELGDIFIADAGNNKIRKVNAAGIIFTAAGTGSAGYGGDGGPATSAIINEPLDVTIDAFGDIVFADYNNNRVRSIGSGNHRPHFTNGSPQTLTLCENSFDSINSLLPVLDTDIGQTETWTLFVAPLHGAVSGLPYIRTSTGGTLTPTGVYYTPTTGYSGRDSFKVWINDGYSVDSTTIIVTVNPAPFAGVISGADSICLGSSTLFTEDSSGGFWLSSDASIASVSGGLVTGNGVGRAQIKYFVTNSCGTDTATKSILVKSLPSAIEPSTPVAICLGTTFSLSDTTTGGTWSASNFNASVSSSGMLTGLAVGVDTITYTSASCSVTKTVTVNTALPSITPISSAMCLGSTDTLRDVTSGGTWSSVSSSVSVVSAGTTGIVLGTGVGVASITYSNGTCSATATVTVNNAPSAISPSSAILCQGRTTVLTDGVSGGTWTSSSTSATVLNGTVSGASAGTAIITYAIGTCITTAPVTVNASPSAITPVTPVTICLGANTTLSDAGGTWSSSNSSISNVGSVSGTVTGSGVGTANITFTNSSGCFVTKPVTVNNAPVPISPLTAVICQGTTTVFTDATSGGVWTSGSTSATVVNGTVSGASAGTATITYSIGTCNTTANVTVNALPAAITPTTPVTLCAGTTTTLTDGAGTWSSGNPTVASIGSLTGTVTGNTAGTANITFTNSSGCITTKTITVNTAPVAITPLTASICVGNTVNLTDGTTGGTWTSGSTAATVVNGTVTGAGAGTATITYSIGTCQTTATVTVNALPAAILPSTATSICAGTTTSLTDGTGTWSSSNSGVASVGSSGTVLGAGAGTANITFTNASGCYVTKPVTVNTAPVAISPLNSNICAGNTTHLTDATSGGTWTSSSTAATVINGTVTGASAGTAIITYSIGTCITTANVTVNALPAAINPSTPVSICIATTAVLTDATTGGAWTSSSTAATVVNGTVTGASAGLATITYTTASGCYVTKTVTVITTPGPITPSPASICQGSTTTLTETTGGGTWTSGSTGVATIGTTGVGTVIINGVSTGTSAITYTVGTCFVTGTVTVSPSPAAISPSTGVSLCVGGTATLTDAGGIWSSTTPAVATVGSASGVVTGITGGTTTISYTNTSGCAATKQVTVNSSATAGTITGATTVCSGTTTSYSDGISGGTWTATNSHATINSITGLITGISPGVDTIKYTVTNPCGTASTTKVITVGAFLTAGSISGGSTMCPGGTVSLTDLAPGGTWSTATGNTSVGTTGIVHGILPGVDTINYTVTSSCGSATATHPVTVNATPDAGTITGPSTVCTGTVTGYTESSTGGTWAMSNSHATINTSGSLTAVSAGTDTIKYTVSNSCGTASTTLPVTIGATLTAGTITGTTNICVGNTATLTDATTGGTWSASNTSVSVTGGTITGNTAGVDTVSYTVSGSCGTATATKTVTVNALPNAGTVSGPSAVCTGSTATYTSTGGPGTGAGTWSVSSADATINSAGVLTPSASGTNTVIYTVTTACGTATATEAITIGTSVSAGTIGGTTTLCTGATATLTETASGGTWSSDNTAVATVGSTGIVTAVSTGTADITYTVSGGSCGTATASTTVTVNLTASAGTVTGPGSVCLGTPATYTDGTTGGTWSVTNSDATISPTGILTPSSTGVDTVIYTVTNSCGTATATEAVTISTTATAGTITGTTAICAGTAVTLADGISGGTWSASNSHATVGTAGNVTGITPGTDTITYTVVTGCGTASTTKTVTVSVAPVAGTIAGPGIMCAGTFTLYTDTTGTPGGAWSISNSLATVTGAGVVTAISTGTTDVIYTVTTACGTLSTSKTITISSTLTAGTISGTTDLCTGGTATLTETVTGGTWSASNTTASISAAGLITGLAPGTDTISYTVTTGCGTAVATKTVTVSATAATGTISGPSGVCAGSLITLTETAGGGAWGSSNGNATITTGGVVTGILPGLDTITYTVSNACGTAITTATLNISPLPTTGTITGGSTLCAGTSITLGTTGTTGGTWSSTNTAVATIGSISGILTGTGAGTATISYTITNACGTFATAEPVTVTAGADAGTIGGPDSVCLGSTIALTETAAGGTWIAGNTNATVTSTGVVTGVSTGTTPITYTVTTGCGTAFAVDVITIAPAAVSGTITGGSIVCVGSGITLTDAIPGGTWYVSNSNASVAGPGIIDGITVGIDTVFYTVSGACGTSVASKIVNVDPVPVVLPVTGASEQCTGTSMTLSDGTAGGVWTSTNPAVATVGIVSGTVTGVSAGTTILTYTVTNIYGCPTSVAWNDTVLSAPSTGTITGATNVCIGSSATLGGSTAGGSWTSSDPSVATINSLTGSLTGISAGTATISYTVTNICGTGTITRTETISPAPVVAPITGGSSECVGSSITLSDATTGGVWSSDNTSVATVGSIDGTVTGVTAGVTRINYTYTGLSGCSVTLTVGNAVLALPVVAAITGTTHACTGTTATLSDATTGGVWGSTDVTVATISGSISSSSATVTPVAIGSTTIIYSVTNIAGCTASASTTFTTDAGPAVAPITGTASECAGNTTTLSDATAGGTWSSSAPATATISTLGVVTGLTAGTATIGYSVTDGSTGCSTTVTALNTVNAIPTVAAITGTTTTICAGATAALSDATTGGTWTSADPTIATTTTTGVVTGITAGSTTINYTVTSTSGCSATAGITVTISPAPSVAAVMGTTDQCIGTTTTLIDITSGGTWSSSNPAVAAISASTGLLTAISAGTTTISYSIAGGTGCAGVASITDTVSTMPAHAAITGTTNTCAGTTTTLSTTATGGIWSSRSTAIAMVNTAGTVTGVTAGTTYIYYTVSNACGAVRDSALVTIHALPDAGTVSALYTSVCAGSELNLSETATGGTWSSADPAIATVNTAGAVTGVTAGTTVINYTVTNTSGCTAEAAITITVGNALPLATVSPATATICPGHAAVMAVTGAGTGVTYEWLRNGIEISGANAESYTAATTGSYSVIVGNGSCSETIEGTVVSAAPIPTIAFIAPDELETGVFTTYQWFKNGVAIAAANSRLITESGAGSYTVVVTNGTGCTDTSAAYIVNSGTGTAVATVSTNDNIIIYPNPATSELHIEAPRGVEVSVRILAMDGREVIANTATATINVGALANGIYLVQIYDTNGLLLKTAKFTKAE
jgi:uncharacterized protein YjdB